MLAVSVTTKAQLFRWFLCFQTSCWWKSRILGERKSEVYLKVIYFSCCFVGWRGSDRCRLVVYGAWLSAGRVAFLSGSWFSVLGRCSKLEANLSISYSPSTFTALSNFFTPVPLTFLSSISLLTSFTSCSVLFFPHPSIPFFFTTLCTGVRKVRNAHRISFQSPLACPSCLEWKHGNPSLPSLPAK